MKRSTPSIDVVPPRPSNVDAYVAASIDAAGLNPRNAERLLWTQIESQFNAVLGSVPTPRNPGAKP